MFTWRTDGFFLLSAKQVSDMTNIKWTFEIGNKDPRIQKMIQICLTAETCPFIKTNWNID